MKILIVIVLILLEQSFGQLISRGQCALPDPLDDYEESKLFGDWYEAWRIESTYQKDFECVNANFSRNQDGYMTEHVDALVRLAGVKQSWDGTYIPKESCPPNEYFLKFSELSTDPGFYAVFTAADWSNWAILYGCDQRGDYKYEYAWVYVKDLDPCDVKAISEALDRIGLCLDDLLKVNHSNCPPSK